ncbi:hypothetical protein Psal006b_00793 [Piscirickettsia salmonis]|uniref:Uncharacterized protein n=1 Tax=Piscirickettsia salmonis TaxID=1238 RepID=A0A1L6TDY3_PISSA|nr:DUF4286 family protein [Piscirickettsia salmonis]AKP74585.1 hypothetical protein PSLF89_3079 [Piscirickettsia salmonis LF-89 = ATCC VR-1361]ALB23587.1 hypothetical protein KU39_2409 [Piscirickettsia salmonis]ALY03454.1 hypothetical protein AWE47_11830 [Piscirickettsia salmonis]AMA43019.1 hypothetical protein AWJ11_12060 [Piscirickettsia salmonis]AOS35488.1 hypothetical protein AVM72_09185 [Piscirickettsia salmonis]
MVIYEMNLIIQSAIYDRYINWLYNHIKELLSLPGFCSAQLLHELTSDTHYHEHRCTVIYKIDSITSLDYFFTHYPHKVQHHSLENFPEGISSAHRVFEVSTEVVNHSLSIKNKYP